MKDGDDADKWMVVGVFKTLTQNVTNYVDYQWETSVDKLTSENLPDLSFLEKISLEQGRAYRFRIAGVNACGVGKFSEVSVLFKALISFVTSVFFSHHHLRHACLVFQALRQALKSRNQPMELIYRGNRRVCVKEKLLSIQCI